MTYDILILGGGPAGYKAAERAAALGLSTLLIEKDKLGGVCLNEGCIPSKTLLYAAKLSHNTNHAAAYGVKASGAVIDHTAVIQRKDKVVQKLVGGIASALKSHGVTVIKGNGVIKSAAPGDIRVAAEDTLYTAKSLLICSGSSAIVPPITGAKEGIDSGVVITNREILSLADVPKRLVIVGGGVIGLEMATYYREAGSNVTVIEMMNSVGGNMLDAEVADCLLKNCQKLGINFCLSAKVTEIKGNAVTFEQKDEAHIVEADKILLSIGRRSNTQGIGIENTSIQIERGNIVTDRYMRTNIPNVYAAGDCNGKYQLAHVAYREAEVAVANIARDLKGGDGDIMRYNAIPSCIYTYPEVGSVGYTLAAAKAEGIPAAERKLTLNYSGRYMAETENGDGFSKLVYDTRTNAIIGMHTIGAYATETIMQGAMLIAGSYTIERAQKLVFPHPTVCEITHDLLFM